MASCEVLWGRSHWGGEIRTKRITERNAVLEDRDGVLEASLLTDRTKLGKAKWQTAIVLSRPLRKLSIKET